MKKIFLLIIFISLTTLNLYGSENKHCLEEYQKIMTPEEKQLQIKFNMFNMFLSCPFSIESLETAVHEAMHLKDTDLLSQLQKYIDDPSLSYEPIIKIDNFIIHSIDGYEFPIPYTDITKPSKIFKKSKNRHLTGAGKMTNIFFKDFLNIYMDKIDMQGQINTNLSTDSFTYGFLMELNGYIHGLKSGLTHNGPLSDLNGLLYFLVSTHIYLTDLEKNHIADYNIIKESTEISNALIKLIDNAFSLISHKDSLNKICDSEELSYLYNFILTNYKSFPLEHFFPTKLHKCSNDRNNKSIIVDLQELNKTTLEPDSSRYNRILCN